MRISFERKNKKGFTLIESLVLVFVISVFVLTSYQVFTLAARYALNTKGRTASVEIATAEMEILRNTPYENITLDPATGPPTGNVISGSSGVGLDYDKVMNINDVGHRIFTEIYYIDDVEDGQGGADSNVNDYKKVIVTVYWGEGVTDMTKSDYKVSLTSYFVPPSGNESAVTEGALSINVVDSSGASVENASIVVSDANGSTAPNFSNLSGTTNASGNALFESLDTGLDTYQIAVTKSGRESIQTEDPYPSSTYYPQYTHASILPGVITTVTIVQDVEPDITLTTKDPFGNIVGDIDFILTGGRVVGSDAISSDPIYANIDLSAVSDTTTGEVDFASDISGYVSSAGKYIFTLDETGYALWKLFPGAPTESSHANLDVIDADGSVDAVIETDMIVIDESIDGAIFTVTDSVTGGPFNCATVQLQRTSSPTYDITRQTDEYGKVYFPVDEDENGSLDTSEELDGSESYNYTVSAPACVDDCTGTCENDCIENACVDGCVIYESDCTSYYSDETDSVTPNGLQAIDVELTR